MLLALFQTRNPTLCPSQHLTSCLCCRLGNDWKSHMACLAIFEFLVKVNHGCIFFLTFCSPLAFAKIWVTVHITLQRDVRMWQQQDFEALGPSSCTNQYFYIKNGSNGSFERGEWRVITWVCSSLISASTLVSFGSLFWFLGQQTALNLVFKVTTWTWT